MENSSQTPLVKKTLLTVGAMVGACVLFVGTLSLAAAAIVGHAVGPSAGNDTSSSEVVPAGNVHGAQRGPAAAGAKAAPAPTTARKNAQVL